MLLPKQKIIFAVDFNTLGSVPSRLAVNDSYPIEWEASLKFLRCFLDRLKALRTRGMWPRLCGSLTCWHELAPARSAPAPRSVAT